MDNSATSTAGCGYLRLPPKALRISYDRWRSHGHGQPEDAHADDAMPSDSHADCLPLPTPRRMPRTPPAKRDALGLRRNFPTDFALALLVDQSLEDRSCLAGLVVQHMGVDAKRDGCVRVAEPAGHNVHWHTGFQQQRGV